MDSAKAKILREFLATLPESLAWRLAKAVEVDRLGGGRSLPHEVILEGLRPVLRHTPQHERTPTPLRLFCRPFEDLLSLAPRKEKVYGAIARGSIKPVWTWLKDTLAPEAHAGYESAVRGDVLGYRLEEARAHAVEFWTLAGTAILDALSGDAARKAARVALGGDLVVADAREMALLLLAGDEISELQAKMPRPTPTLGDDLVWMLRGIYDRVAARVPDAGAYVAVVAMRRLERPWEAMKLPLLISRQTQDTLISSTDMGLVGEILFNEIENHAATIRSLRPQAAFDADALVSHVTRFAELSNGLVKEIEMRRDGKWGQRLMKERAAVAGAMDAFMERAPRDILAALPTQKSGSYAGGPRVPDLARAPDAEKAERALGFARLIVGCRAIAAKASFGAKLKDADTEAAVALKGYNEDIVKELRGPEGPRRDNAEAYFAIAAELTTLLFSAEEGEFLRRRARAAMGIQAAA